ncbi:DNA ligase 1-like [Haliotis rubra]|uniref:DNA ligase 1-like n=1 Tax=Haliotis rubra TaxID=36100 RepID=UPI001EE5EB97|nr:DNA ligase 1-like [Haliotis rubra]
MTDAQEDENAKEDSEPLRRTRPPSKKRLDDEVDALMVEIREKEAELKSIGGRGEDSLKNIRAEKDATFERRKKVDSDLKTLNQAITQKMNALSKLQSSLHYTTEEKHNDAIRKLEWNMKVQNFKLSQEKKIVAEIDSLKRSKKMLSSYLSMKKEIDESRDRQRRMREERDHYFRTVNQLKAKEEDIRKKNSANKSRAEVLKKEINELYERKRSIVSEFRKQRDVFQDTMKRQRAESFRKREEERRALLEAQQKEIEEMEALKEPFEDEKSLCNTLIQYLQKIGPSGDTTDASASSHPTEEAASSSLACAPALENEDGYRLLRRSDEEEFPPLGRRTSKSRRRSLKLSMTRPVTHTPHVISQFSSLTLNAPSSLVEIPTSLEQLQGRKLYYEQKAREMKNLNADASPDALLSDISSLRRCRTETWGFMGDEQPIVEELSQSEAGISATESVVCEMSRQASKTESCESANDTRPSDMLMEELLQTCCDGNCAGKLKSDYHDIDSHSLSDSSDTPRSESTLEGSNGESMGSGNDFERELHSDSLHAGTQSHICSSSVGKPLNTTEHQPQDVGISTITQQPDCDKHTRRDATTTRSSDRTLTPVGAASAEESRQTDRQRDTKNICEGNGHIKTSDENSRTSENKSLSNQTTRM